jgi:threonylcarbamoyladenosine tRNA methylthiotransferase MtaB
MCEIPGDFRVRLSSIEATEVTKELISVLKEYGERIVPHLHLCLQSGSDSVLRRMRRRWGTKMFLDRCQLVRESLKKPAITTDIIVGFPGETEMEFNQTLETCRKAGFSKIHAFPFSARRGTPAAEMPNQIEKSVRSERVSVLTDVENHLRREYYDSLVGENLEVLIESSKALCSSSSPVRLPKMENRKQPTIGENQQTQPPQSSDQREEKDTSNHLIKSRETILRGTSCRYAPVEILVASKPGHSVDVGELAQVRITASDGEKLDAVVVEK